MRAPLRQCDETGYVTTDEPKIVLIEDRSDPAIRRFLAGAEEADGQLDHWVSDAETVYGAVVDGGVVGIGARDSSALHPTRDWVSVRVHPSHRGSGIGTTLLGSCRAQRPDRSTKVRISSSEVAGLRFAAQHGFTRLVSSADVVVSGLPVPALPPDIEVVDVSKDDPAFLRALGALYVASHLWDPCVGLELADVRALLAGDDVIPGTARVVRRGEEVIGVGVAYSGRPAGSVEMANFGSVDPDAGDGVDIAHTLLDSIGRPFLDAGVTITVECDFGPGTNTALGQLLDRIASRPSTTVEILARSSV